MNRGIIEKDDMKREYDFSNAVRGKFYRKGVELSFPIYVDGSMHKRLERLAKKRKSR